MSLADFNEKEKESVGKIVVTQLIVAAGQASGEIRSPCYDTTLAHFDEFGTEEQTVEFADANFTQQPIQSGEFAFENGRAESALQRAGIP